MNQWHYILSALFHGEANVDFFKKITSITDYINFYDSDSSFTVLTKLFPKNIHKKNL